jgi:hypothetical protein
LTLCQAYSIENENLLPQVYIEVTHTLDITLQSKQTCLSSLLG